MKSGVLSGRLFAPPPARTGRRGAPRYAARWAVEVAIEDSKQVFGAGQARNRTAAAVERTLPFALACQAAAVVRYATAGHHPADTAARRLRAPWYTWPSPVCRRTALTPGRWKNCSATC